jgi:hypothetical protein
VDEIPTIKVKPQSAEQGDFVLINEADFDPKVHERFEAGGGATPSAARLDNADKKPAPRRRKRRARK